MVEIPYIANNMPEGLPPSIKILNILIKRSWFGVPEKLAYCGFERFAENQVDCATNA